MDLGLRAAHGAEGGTAEGGEHEPRGELEKLYREVVILSTTPRRRSGTGGPDKVSGADTSQGPSHLLSAGASVTRHPGLHSSAPPLTRHTTLSKTHFAFLNLNFPIRTMGIKLCLIELHVCISLYISRSLDLYNV